MAKTITIMSWNIESLGAKKAHGKTVPPQKTEIVNFIVQVVSVKNIDLIGIMEIKGGVGKLLKNWLIAALNNTRPAHPDYEWMGQLSSRQDGGTQEEYLYLWRDEAMELTLDGEGQPGPTSLIGVADMNILEGYGGKAGWDAAQAKALLAALTDNGYLRLGQYGKSKKTKTLRVVPEAWYALNKMGAAKTVTFAAAPKAQPPAWAKTPAVCAQLASQIVDTDILRFISNGDRSPYLANFLLKGKPLMLSLLHAPGPDQMPEQAVNIIGLSLPLARQAVDKNLLIMGDFNVKWPDTQQYVVYGRCLDSDQKFGFGIPVPRTYADVFAPIKKAPLHAKDLMPLEKTSLTNQYLPDKSYATAVLGSTYDKFFFKGTNQPNEITAAGPLVHNLVQAIANDQGLPTYNSTLAISAMTYFRAFRGVPFLTKAKKKLNDTLSSTTKRANYCIQQLSLVPLPHPPPAGSAALDRFNLWTENLGCANQALAEVNLSLTNITWVTTLMSNAVATVPTGVGSGLAIYRFAISDHLPISVNLTAT